MKDQQNFPTLNLSNLELVVSKAQPAESQLKANSAILIEWFHLEDWIADGTNFPRPRHLLLITAVCSL